MPESTVLHENQGMAGFTRRTTDSSFFIKTTNMEHAMQQAKNETVWVQSTSDIRFAQILLNNNLISQVEYNSLLEITNTSKRNDFLSKIRANNQLKYSECLSRYTKIVDIDEEKIGEYSKKLLKAEIFGMNIEYLALKFLNLLHLKTPSELLLNQNQTEATIVKRGVCDSDEKNFVSNEKENDAIDKDWFVRRQTVLMILNIVDASINIPNHNTIQIKNNGKLRYADIDPIIIASEFKDLPFAIDEDSWFARQRKGVIAAEENAKSLSVENFFKSLREFSMPNGNISTDNQKMTSSKKLMDFLEDIDTNEEKQIQIVNALQKTLHYLKKNKGKMLDEIKNFKQKDIKIDYTSSFNPYLPETSSEEACDILTKKINKLENILEGLSLKFKSSIINYDTDTKNPSQKKYTSRNIPNKINSKVLQDFNLSLNENTVYHNGGSFSVRHPKLQTFKKKRLLDKNAYYFQCNMKNLNNLQNSYRNVKGAPRFIDDLLHLKNGWNLTAMAQNSDLFELANCDGTNFLIKPNPQYVEEKYINSPKNLKNKPDGFGIIAWFIDDHIMSQSNLKEIIDLPKQEKESKIKEIIKDEPYNKSVEKVSNRDTISAIEKQHSSQIYLASVLDINVRHLQAMKNLKQKMKDHLKENYDINLECTEDCVLMYFHIPLPEVTTTVHLHIRVNQGVNSLDAANSITLDEIIDCLESGISVKQYLCKTREKILFPVGDFEEFVTQANVKTTKILNPVDNISNMKHNPICSLLEEDHSLAIYGDKMQNATNQILKNEGQKLCNSV